MIGTSVSLRFIDVRTGEGKSEPLFLVFCTITDSLHQKSLVTFVWSHSGGCNYTVPQQLNHRFLVHLRYGLHSTYLVYIEIIYLHALLIQIVRQIVGITKCSTAIISEWKLRDALSFIGSSEFLIIFTNHLMHINFVRDKFSFYLFHCTWSR